MVYKVRPWWQLIAYHEGRSYDVSLVQNRMHLSQMLLTCSQMHWPLLLITKLNFEHTVWTGNTINMWFGDVICNDIKTMCQCTWNPVYFHWKCPLLLWPWPRSIWSGWYMLGNSSIGASMFLIQKQTSQYKDDSLCHFKSLKYTKKL